jgi:succinyl-CoA synthetase alpha subunit
MPGQLSSQQLRLPFLDAQPWRVAVIAPTGRYARNQVAAMAAAGTPIIGGVALGRGGTSHDGLPLYDRIGDLPEPPTIALIYTPAEGVRDAIAECAGAGIPTIMAVAEYVPVHDALAAATLARAAGSWLVGPNTLGLIGRNPHEYLQALADDAATEAVLFCGEIGGDKEYEFAETARRFPKPIIAMVVGRHAPAQKQMGHAGALIGHRRESAQSKLEALAAAGCRIAMGLEDAVTMAKALKL